MYSKFDFRSISIIIPALNEADNLSKLLPYLKSITKNSDISSEIIVVDAKDSTDNLESICTQENITYIRCGHNGRSYQLCQGGQATQSDILYFVHADTTPPTTFVDDILEALKSGNQAGCFAYRFRNATPILLKINSWFTQFQTFFTGGGDQGLFIIKDVYEQLGGFAQECTFMEDFQLYKAIRNNDIPFTIVQNKAIVSNRKYKSNGYLKVQIVQGILLWGFYRGFSADRLQRIYRRLL